MAHQKTQRVYADSIVIHYNNNWYDILFTGLVAIEAARLRYGLVPSVALFIPLGMLTPFCPPLNKRGTPTETATSSQVIYPDPPPMTAEIEDEMRVRLFRNRIQGMNSNIFSDLTLLMNENSAEFTTLLTNSLMP